MKKSETTGPRILLHRHRHSGALIQIVDDLGVEIGIRVDSGTIDKNAGATIPAAGGLPAFPTGTDIGAKFDALAMRTQVSF